MGMINGWRPREIHCACTVPYVSDKGTWWQGVLKSIDADIQFPAPPNSSFLTSTPTHVPQNSPSALAQTTRSHGGSKQCTGEQNRSVIFLVSKQSIDHRLSQYCRETPPVRSSLCCICHNSKECHHKLHW